MIDVQADAILDAQARNCVLPDSLRNRVGEEVLRTRIAAIGGIPAYILGRHFAEHHEDEAGEPFIYKMRDADSMERGIIFAAAWMRRGGNCEVGNLPTSA